MHDVLQAVREIQTAFDSPGYPEAFLAQYDQMECLGCHNGVETFLVRRKTDGSLHIAKCYDRTVYEDLSDVEGLGDLCHHGLPAFGEVFRSDGMICTLRAYVEGEPLSEYCRNRELTRQQIVEICVALCDVLTYLHERPQPIIHRDIKPENVIIRPDGTPVLIDFDIARLYKGEADSDTRFFGTRGYAAPEQYGFAQTDARADVYSLGVLLRYLLTGSVRPNPNVKYYQPLSRIVEKCTAFSPKDRFADVRAVKKALMSANPKAQVRRAVCMTLCALAACALLAFGGVKLYEYLTFSPFTDGHIPLVMQDKERVDDAVAYLQEKYGTHLFDETNEYMTIGLLKQALIEMYGMDAAYVNKLPTAEIPTENPDCFLPWGLGDEQCFDKEHMAYFATKIYWPEAVADWFSIKEDVSVYPGILVSMDWCEKYGILTGVNRPYDITRGEAAIALANADRVYTALNEQGK